MKVGFIGLGNMGAAMAQNLIKAGHSLTVYNRTRSKAHDLQSIGAKVANSPAEAASNSDVLITMLADDRALQETMFAPGNAIDSFPAGGIHISMSTISVALSRELVKAHQKKRQQFLAAPVFGRPEAAAAAKLFIVAAGSPQDMDQCKSLFDVMGQKTFHVGEDPPSATLMKIAGNFLITCVIESLAESFALIRKSGIDPNKFLEVLTESLFAAPIYRNYGSMIAADQFEPVGFKLPLGMKDNRLLLDAAEHLAVPMPIASLVRDRFIAALAQGLGEADWASIARISYKNAGL
jgi:3-hydroxyisobutyrate dehydrogenase-like beta-hydroxyacid dehydrogenase